MACKGDKHYENINVKQIQNKHYYVKIADITYP